MTLFLLIPVSTCSADAWLSDKARRVIPTTRASFQRGSPSVTDFRPLSDAGAAQNEVL
jgi:hypothetical protein